MGEGKGGAVGGKRPQGAVRDAPSARLYLFPGSRCSPSPRPRRTESLSPKSPPPLARSCGGCWSFSAAETLESHIAIQTGKLFTFSEQEILACT